jgi:hypothetical protein
MVFTSASPLKNEYDTLLYSIFSNAPYLVRIIEAIANSNYGLTRSEILQVTGYSDNSDFSKALRDLEISDFIAKKNMYPNNKTNGSKYIIIDFFTLFLLKYVVSKKENDWSALYKSQEVNIYNGLQFEKLCYTHIEQITKSLDMYSVKSDIGYYENKDCQIDMVIERKDDIAYVVEMKFYNTEYKSSEEDEKRQGNRINIIKNILPKRYSVYSLLITTFGLAKTRYSFAYDTVLTINSLFSEV